MSKNCNDIPVEEIEKYIEEKGLTFENQDCIIALAKLYSVPIDELKNITEDGNRYEVLGKSYIAGNDDEMEEEYNNSLESYLDECEPAAKSPYLTVNDGRKMHTLTDADKT